MDYFYLKLGKGNSQASQWLAGDNQLKQPAAPIYFDNFSADEYKLGKGKSEPREFIRRGDIQLRDKTLMVVIHQGEVLILRPTGEVRFLPSQTLEDGFTCTTKAMPVEIVARKKCKDVPAVLAGIAANRYYSSGTFRRINDWGNYKAIDCLVGLPRNGAHWKLEKNFEDQLLECLGCTEIETLVAKVFEAHGCFVPAYRGGVMKDIDLFAHNKGEDTICVGPVSVPPRGSVSIQVKRWAEKMKCPAEVDWLIGIGVTGPRTVNAKQLLELAKQAPPVFNWLCHSLEWLPPEYLQAVLKRNLLTAQISNVPSRE